MKKLLILLLSVLMLASCASTSVSLQETPAAEVQASVSGSIVEVSKYGNVYLDVTVPEFLSVFTEGDLVTIKAGGQEVLAPVVTAYSDVDTAQPLVKVDGTNVEVALSYADFAGTYGTALGSVIDITMAEKGGYLTEYEIRHLVKSEDRADYSSDVQFANFRSLSGGNIIKNLVYRSSSPSLGDERSAYADRLAKEAGIRTVVNLADSQESLLEGLDPDSYYASLNEEGRVICLNMGIDYRSEDFATKLAEGIRFVLADPQAPVLIHCNEGKDRAGLVSALLEALAGATMDEIVSDYMTTYENYYGVKKGSQQYEAISGIIREFFNEINGRPFPESMLKAVSEAYLTGRCGLSEAEVDSLEALITK